MTRKLTPAQIDDLISRYLAGERQYDIAEALGVTQATVSKWVLKRGVNISRSDAAIRRSGREDSATKAANASAAHAAVRGMKRSPEDLVKRAATKERLQSHATDEERSIGALISQSAPIVLQKAVGKYNLDIGVANTVAVELFGGNWHTYGRHRARLPQRVMDLADAGYNLLIAWTHAVHPLSFQAVADDVLAYLERTRSDPSFRRQYRVIWGDGEFIAAGCVDDDELTLVPTGIRGAYASRHLDERVAGEAVRM